MSLVESLTVIEEHTSAFLAEMFPIKGLCSTCIWGHLLRRFYLLLLVHQTQNPCRSMLVSRLMFLHRQSSIIPNLYEEFYYNTQPRAPLLWHTADKYSILYSFILSVENYLLNDFCRPTETCFFFFFLLIPWNYSYTYRPGQFNRNIWTSVTLIIQISQSCGGSATQIQVKRFR